MPLHKDGPHSPAQPRMAHTQVWRCPPTACAIARLGGLSAVQRALGPNIWMLILVVFCPWDHDGRGRRSLLTAPQLQGHLGPTSKDQAH